MVSSGLEGVVSADKRATVSWQSLSVTVKARKSSKVNGKVDSTGARLLDNISGRVEAGRVLAIMGPSGSGKTTLLDTLAGRTPSSLCAAGDIRVNGHRTQMSYGTAAYVPQHDLFTGSLTVRETLTFTAHLRLRQTAAERQALVNEVLRAVGLTVAASTPVGTVFIKGISGGQQRRLSLACEMLVNPSLIFLDEPTSGLDSASAFFCVGAIKHLARQGRTAIMSIHQPSAEVYELFDDLLLLSKGAMIYSGDAAGAGQFYTDAGVPCPRHRALADHFLFSMNTDFIKAASDFASSSDPLHLAGSSAGGGGGDGGEPSPSFLPGMPAAVASSSAMPPPADAAEGIERLRTHFEGTQRAAVEASVERCHAEQGPVHAGIQNHVGRWTQFRVLLHRTVLAFLRDLGAFWLRVVMYTCLCVCLGTVYFQLGSGWNEVVGRVGLLIFTTSFLSFMAVSGFPTFVEDIKIFTRERLNGYYGVLPYTLANTAASLPFLAVIAITCMLLVSLLAGLDMHDGRFLFRVLNLLLVLMTSEAIVMAIATVVPHPLPGIALAAALMGVFMPVAGYLVPLDVLPDPVWRYPMHFVSLYSFSLHAAVLNEYHGADGWACPCTLQPNGCGTDSDCTLTGDEVLRILGFTLDRTKGHDILVLIANVVVYRAAFFFLLKAREAFAK